MFYGKLSLKQEGLRASQLVLQFHQALNLLHHGPVRSSVQMPHFQPEVHRVLLLGTV